MKMETNLRKLKVWFKSIIWPWQYKTKLRELKIQIAHLEAAGWTMSCAFYHAAGSYDGCMSYKMYQECEQIFGSWSWNNEPFAISGRKWTPQTENGKKLLQTLLDRIE